MRSRVMNVLLAACLTAGLAAGSLPAAGLGVKAAADVSATALDSLTIQESELNQLLTDDIELPAASARSGGAAVTYSVSEQDAEYVSIENSGAETTLKIKKRPQAGEEDYKFVLKASVKAGNGTVEKEFPLTIRANLSGDSYAGYVYVCFANTGRADDQQVHFFLSEDGLNWTALNGCKPIFRTGTDYAANIESYGSGSVNYKVADGTVLSETTKGDASVLFPFEGRDQGIRDPYLIRGSRADGSDSNKVWILATDLNTMSSQYNGNKTTNVVGNWGLMTSGNQGSRSLFVWETEDWVHWTRRYIDVATQADAYMAWAPEAIYNPVKDNYLVYWSARSKVDGGARDRLYCNETKDFVNFGPTKLCEQEPFYRNYLPDGVGSADDGYGNIDTSQLWVAETKADGTVNPYGTLYRLVKDETQNHIELMSAKTVLDPKYEGNENQSAYDATDPKRITPYTFEGKTYATVADLNTLTSDKTNIKRADIVYNWFINESVADHFTKISQKDMEKYYGAYEGATMFKFIDRDEWCIMIDNYGSNVRYEPYTTTNLAAEDSIKKVADGYGRTGNDIGCHGGMIPITVAEYNTLIDTYNADPEIDNYHEINYISLDTAAYAGKAQELQTAAQSQDYSAGVKSQMNSISAQITAASQELETVQSQKNTGAWTGVYAKLDKLVKRADLLLANKLKSLPADMQAEEVYFDEDSVIICTKATEGLKKTVTLYAEADLDSETPKITFESSNDKIASVDSRTGVVTAKKAGKITVTATAPGGAKAVCSVTVKGIPDKLTPTPKNKKISLNLKKKKTAQIKVAIPAGTVCSKFSYKSSKPKIVAVEKNTGGNVMKITAKKKGSAKITVTAANNSKAKVVFNVTVKK